MITFPRLSLGVGDVVVFDDEAYEITARHEHSKDRFDVEDSDGNVTDRHIDWFSNQTTHADTIRIERTEDRSCFSRKGWCNGPDAPLQDGEPFGGLCSSCYFDERREVPRTISQPVMDVWGEYDDPHGHVADLLDDKVEEFDQAKNIGEQKAELLDMVTYAIRVLTLMGYHPEAEIVDHVDEQNPEELVDEYEQ